MTIMTNKPCMLRQLLLSICTTSDIVWCRHRSFQPVLPKFPFPYGQLLGRHQMVKPRPPPVPLDVKSSPEQKPVAFLIDDSDGEEPNTTTLIRTKDAAYDADPSSKLADISWTCRSLLGKMETKAADKIKPSIENKWEHESSQDLHFKLRKILHQQYKKDQELYDIRPREKADQMQQHRSPQQMQQHQLSELQARKLFEQRKSLEKTYKPRTYDKHFKRTYKWRHNKQLGKMKHAGFHLPGQRQQKQEEQDKREQKQHFKRRSDFIDVDKENAGDGNTEKYDDDDNDYRAATIQTLPERIKRDTLDLAKPDSSYTDPDEDGREKHAHSEYSDVSSASAGVASCSESPTYKICKNLVIDVNSLHKY